MIAFLIAAACAFDAQAWKAQVLKATPAELPALLKQLDFRKVPSGSDEIGDDACYSQPKVKLVDVFPFAVQVVFTMCDGDFLSQRIAVLQDGCKVGDLSIDVSSRERPCGQKRLPRTISFAKGVLKVDDRLGYCNRGESSEERKTTLYEIRKGALQKLTRKQ